jgi:hypothetical protein
VPSGFHVVLSSKRNDIHRATLMLSVPPGLQCFHAQAIMDAPVDGVIMKASEDAVFVSNIPPRASVHLVVPHSDASSFPAVVCHMSRTHFRCDSLLPESRHRCPILDQFPARCRKDASSQPCIEYHTAYCSQRSGLLPRH